MSDNNLDILKDDIHVMYIMCIYIHVCLHIKNRYDQTIIKLTYIYIYRRVHCTHIIFCFFTYTVIIAIFVIFFMQNREKKNKRRRQWFLMTNQYLNV